LTRALVTGGFGFLGSFIVRELLDEGVEVRVLAVPGEPRQNLEGLDVEVVEGDVRSIDDVTRAVRGVRHVFHAAAIYLDWAPDPSLMYDVNLRGTFHVMEACRRAGIETVVYTASIVALGRPAPGRLGDERTPYEAWEIDFPYSRSKLFSHMLAECFGAWDLDVRVVCPGIVLGPGDVRPTPSGQLIINASRGLPGIYTDGGASYVDVRDAARVHRLALRRGRPGERYLAAAHNLDNRALLSAIDAALGRERRLVKVPVAVARNLARAMEAHARRSGEPPLLARDFFEYALRPSFFDSHKAREELGATFRPLEDTLRDAIADFRARGLIAR
jgi:dihydroflavonol-4-reductase